MFKRAVVHPSAPSTSSSSSTTTSSNQKRYENYKPSTRHTNRVSWTTEDKKYTMNNVIQAMHVHKMHGMEDLQHIQVYEHPCMHIPASNNAGDDERMIIAPDFFRIKNADESFNEAPPFLNFEASSEWLDNDKNVKRFGGGVFGNLYRFADGTLGHLCFKIQKAEADEWIKTFHIAENEDAVADDDDELPARKQKKKKKQKQCPENNIVIEDGYYVESAVLEPTVHFVVQETLRKMDTEKFGSTLMDGQSWAQFVPKLYGTFVVSFLDNKSIPNIKKADTESCTFIVMVMEYLDGFIPLRNFLENAKKQTMAVSDAFHPIYYNILNPLLATLESHPDLHLRHYDLHDQNIMVHPDGNGYIDGLCLLDFGLSGVLLPSKWFCSLDGALEFAVLFDKMRFGSLNAILLTIDYSSFNMDGELWLYNRAKIIKSVCMNFENPSLSTWKRQFAQMKVDEEEATYSLPKQELELMTQLKPTNPNKLPFLPLPENYNTNELACSDADMTVLARTLYHQNNPVQVKQQEQFLVFIRKMYNDGGDVEFFQNHIFQQPLDLDLIAQAKTQFFDRTTFYDTSAAGFTAAFAIPFINALQAFTYSMGRATSLVVAALVLNNASNIRLPRPFEQEPEAAGWPTLPSLPPQAQRPPYLKQFAVAVRYLLEVSDVATTTPVYNVIFRMAKTLIENPSGCRDFSLSPQTMLDFQRNAGNIRHECRALKDWLLGILRNPREYVDYLGLHRLVTSLDDYTPLLIGLLKAKLTEEFQRKK